MAQMTRRDALLSLTVATFGSSLRAQAQDEKPVKKEEAKPDLQPTTEYASLLRFSEHCAAMMLRIKAIDQKVGKGELAEEWAKKRKDFLELVRLRQDAVVEKLKELFADGKTSSPELIEAANEQSGKLGKDLKTLDGWCRLREKELGASKPKDEGKEPAPKVAEPGPKPQVIVLTTPLGAELMQTPFYKQTAQLISKLASKGIEGLDIGTEGLVPRKDWRSRLEAKRNTFPQHVPGELLFESMLKIGTQIAAITTAIAEVDKVKKPDDKEWAMKKKEVMGELLAGTKGLEAAFEKALDSDPKTRAAGYLLFKEISSNLSLQSDTLVIELRLLGGK